MKFIALITISLFLFLFNTDYLHSEEDEQRVGAMLCLTGPCAEWGENSRRGIELAKEEINAAGGIMGKLVKVVYQDTAEAIGGVGAVSAYRQLRLDKTIQYFIGPTWTSGGLPLAPIISKEKGVIAVSPSLGVAGYNEAGDNIFNVWPHDDYATKSLAQFAIKSGFKTASILSSQDPWVSVQTESFQSEFAKLGGKILVVENPLPNNNDLRTEALKIKNSNPDVVFLSSWHAMGIGAKKLRSLGYTGKMLVILMDKSRLEQAGDSLEGAVYARYPDPNIQFKESYKKRWGVDPGITSDTAYDSLSIYKSAVLSVSSFDTDKVIGALQKIEHMGASGRIVFDQKGGVIKTPVFWMIKNKEMVPMED